ncbi:MAG: hypothetical protein FJ304_00980 [Planctomycetes bacterium]|nr:hypothetical protein [Planctomycetota bacterium]
MTQGDLTHVLTAGGLFPIVVEGGIGENEAQGYRYLGDLDGFVHAAVALGAKCAFVASRTFVAGDLTMEEYNGEESVEVDLTTYAPDLVPYRARVGQCCGHRVWVSGPTATLTLLLPEPWWTAFGPAREGAIAAVHERRAAADEQEELEQQRRTEQLVQRLREFIKDKEFIQQTTQLAMQAYAVETAPELEVLGDRVLKTEIQALDAKIKAKGLRAKRTKTDPKADS